MGGPERSGGLAGPRVTDDPMIVYEAAAAPSVRAGELLLGGRRLAGRLFPYGADAADAAFRFDPVERRFLFRRPEATVPVGPSDPRPWTEALSRVPPGPVLVGPCAAAKKSAALIGPRRRRPSGQGRPVYLLDPEPAGLPPTRPEPRPWSCAPGERGGPKRLSRPGGRRARPDFDARPSSRISPAGRGSRAPWRRSSPPPPTPVPKPDGPGAHDRRRGTPGHRPGAPAASPRGRRAILRARPPWRLGGAAPGFSPASPGGGRPPRPGLAPAPSLGAREAGANAAASARLEELAELSGAGDHRIALLHAAVRFIDESGRDLASVEREGNFGLFPFGEEIAKEAAAALREAR